MKSLPIRREPRALQGQKPRAEPTGRMSAPRDGGDLRESAGLPTENRIKSWSHFDLNLKLQGDLSYKQWSAIYSSAHSRQKCQKSNYPWNALASYHMGGGHVSVSFISQCFPNSSISLTLSMIISWCSWFEWGTMLNSKMHLFKPRTTVYMVRHTMRSPRNWGLRWEQQMQWNGEQNCPCFKFSFLPLFSPTTVSLNMYTFTTHVMWSPWKY